MGLFDFFKKKKVGEIVKAKKELIIDEIELRTREEIKSIDNESEKLGEKAVFITKDVVPLLKERVKVLKEVNLDKRREDQKLKIIIKENLSFYISHLEKLIENLEKINKSKDFKDCADKVNLIFEDFLKNSAKNYEKATILIGKEFEVINLIFKNMAQELNPLLAQNLENNKKKEKLKLLLEKFKNISEIQLTENQINKSVLSLELEKNNEQEEINKKEQEKQKLVNSKTYQEHKKEKEQIEEEKLDIKREIQDIKTKINLKELAKVYHGHEKKHKVIQRYMDNFDQAINEGNKELDNILKERVLNFSLSAVAERKKKLEEHTNSSELAEKKLEKEIESKSIGLGEIDKKIEEEKVKLTKFSERREALVSEVKKEASEIFS